MGEAVLRTSGSAQADVALAWLLANPVVVAPIIGLAHHGPVRRRAFVRWTSILKPEVLKRLDQIFPGPGDTAPEAYAW